MKSKEQKEEERMYELLTKFGNDHTLAKDIKVHVSAGHTSYTSKDRLAGARYEDCQFLSSLVSGAQSFLHWCARHGYEVRKKRA